MERKGLHEDETTEHSAVDVGWVGAFLAQCGVAELATVLAYAEVRAIFALGLCASPMPPEMLVRDALVATLDGDWPWSPADVSLVAHLQLCVRSEMRLVLDERQREVDDLSGHRGTRVCRAQVGSLEGLEQVAHDAGTQAGNVRQADVATIEIAVRLADLVRSNLENAASRAAGRQGGTIRLAVVDDE